MTDASIQAEAAAWVARLGGRAQPEGSLPEFDAWLSRDPRHPIAYENALRTWRDLEAMGGMEQYLKLLGSPTLRERLLSMLTLPQWAAALTGVAAIAVVALLVLGMPWRYAPDSVQVVTRPTEIRETTLPDGSHVTLGAQSQLEYDVLRDERRATLRSGDAFFAVNKDPASFFSVVIDDVQVKVVGTQFEVRRRNEGVTIAVQEGVVEVFDRGARVQRLTAGESVSIGAGDREVRKVSTADVGAWRSGRLVYDGAQLRDVVADANRYADARIVVVDPDLASMRVTTSFRTAQIDGLLESLQVVLPLAAERQTDGTILLRKR